MNDLIDVSHRRAAWLREWYIERRLDLLCRADETAELPPVRGQKPWATTPPPYDEVLADGDIRLVPGATTDPYRFSYFAILSIDGGNGTVHAAPFSRYSVPATLSEWKTGLTSSPLMVLQLWAAMPVPAERMWESWRCCSFTGAELAKAREVYRHYLAGTWLPFPLREEVGVDIHDHDDPRIAYQEEELKLYAPLRKALFQMIERGNK